MLRSAIRRLQSFVFGTDGPKYIPDRIYPDDVFIVSYPKSGNTWMRFLIGNYLTGNECTFENCHRISPDIHMNPEHCANVNRPRFIKSHAPYRPQYSNIVYIVRDGRDVAVSYYYHCIRNDQIGPDTPFRSFVEMFNEGEVDDFGVWGEHVMGWIENAGSILLVRYEDLQEDAESELRRVLEFAGIEVQKKRLTSAVEASSFENMKKTEVKERELGRIENTQDKKVKWFMRKGETKEWKSKFDKKMVNLFNNVHENALDNLGYV